MGARFGGGAVIVAHGLAEGARIRGKPGLGQRMVQRQKRQDGLAKAVGPFEMGVAGMNEGIDADAAIFVDPFGHDVRIADKRGACAPPPARGRRRPRDSG